MNDHILGNIPPEDWADQVIKSLAWLMWIVALGALSVRLTWRDNITKVEREYIIPGLI